MSSKVKAAEFIPASLGLLLACWLESRPRLSLVRLADLVADLLRERIDRELGLLTRNPRSCISLLSICANLSLWIHAESSTVVWFMPDPIDLFRPDSELRLPRPEDRFESYGVL